MHLYNDAMGIWQHTYTFHITDFAKVNSGEMMHGQEVLGITCAHGLCLVLSSFCKALPQNNIAQQGLQTGESYWVFSSLAWKAKISEPCCPVWQPQKRSTGRKVEKEPQTKHF